MTLLAIAFFSAIGLGLSLSSSTARLADGNHADGLAMLNVAESALELAARDLAGVPDWNRVLDGTIRSTIVDGPSGGSRTVAPGTVLDLTRATNQLTCGRDAGCTDDRVHASTEDRPWGRNNARWQPFLHARLPRAADLRRGEVAAADAPYAVVWIGDDGRETDDNPWVDGGGVGADGRYVVRARSEVFGPGGARRAIDAELARVCRPTESGEVCLPGIRVQSWRILAAVP